MFRYFSTHTLYIYLLLTESLNSLPTTPPTEDVNTADHHGIMFNKVKTVILADKYEPVQFLLPFPTIPEAFDNDITNITKVIREYWNAIPADCEELQDRVIPDTHTEDLVTLIQQAHEEAQGELHHLKATLQSMLVPPDRHSRPKRAIVVGALAAAAAGAGVLALGTYLSGGCIGGILGPCDNERKHCRRTDMPSTQPSANYSDNQQQWTELNTGSRQEILHRRRRTEGHPTRTARARETSATIMERNSIHPPRPHECFQDDDSMQRVSLHESPSKSAANNPSIKTSTHPHLYPKLQSRPMELSSDPFRCHPRISPRTTPHVSSNPRHPPANPGQHSPTTGQE